MAGLLRGPGGKLLRGPGGDLTRDIDCCCSSDPEISECDDTWFTTTFPTLDFNITIRARRNSIPNTGTGTCIPTDVGQIAMCNAHDNESLTLIPGDNGWTSSVPPPSCNPSASFGAVIGHWYYEYEEPFYWFCDSNTGDGDDTDHSFFNFVIGWRLSVYCDNVGTEEDPEYEVTYWFMRVEGDESFPSDELGCPVWYSKIYTLPQLSSALLSGTMPVAGSSGICIPEVTAAPFSFS